MKSNTLLTWLCLGAVTLGGLACAAEPPAPAPLPTTAASLLPPIKALIGDAACDSNEQCRSIGVGSKPCGGPSGYMAWSTKQTDGKALQAQVDRHAKAQREEDQRAGMNSNCLFTPDPGARCVPTPAGGRCQINSVGPAAKTGAQ